MLMRPVVIGCAAVLSLASCKIQVNEEGNDSGPGDLDADPDDGGTDGTEVDGDAAALCPELGGNGACNDNELIFCDGDTEQRIDCATVGATCEVIDGRAECASGATRTSGCGSLDALGGCEGSDLLFCASTSFSEYVEEIPCGAYGQICDPDGASDGGAICMPHGPCPIGLDESGRCVENQLEFCQDSELYRFDCGSDRCGDVDGFFDCFVPGSFDGCGTETQDGRCEGQTRVACMGGTVSREDCAVIGYECLPDGEGSRCQRGDCPVSCPTGHSCTAGLCVPTSTPSRQWTYMVYMVGDNNLSDAAWTDLNEMEAVGSTSTVTVAVEVEFSDNSWYSYRVPDEYRDNTYRLRVAADSDEYTVSSMASATSLGNRNMSDPAQLTEFIRDAAARYPARHYALVMWDHGNGWSGGFQDVGDAGEMSLGEILDGIRDSGVHFDLLNFDACLMAMHEVGLAFRGVADVLIASEEVEPGAGDPYDDVLAPLVATPSMSATTLAETVVNAFGNRYTSSYRDRDVTKSAVDLRRLEELREQVADLSLVLGQDLVVDRNRLVAALTGSDILRYHVSDYADLGSILGAVEDLGGGAASTASVLNDWLETSGVVIRSRAAGDAAASRGLSIFLPAFRNYWGGVPSVEDYRSTMEPFAIEAWSAFLANLSATDEAEPPSEDDRFTLVLRWGDEPGGYESDADLDLHVYEPGGTLAAAAIGSVSPSGFLSDDSVDSGESVESYELAFQHASGSYIVLVHLYSAPAGAMVYPTLTVVSDALPLGQRQLTRGRVENRELVLVPMSSENPLTGVIDADNVGDVERLVYTNLWYATVMEVD